MKKIIKQKKDIVIYQAKSGAIALRGDFGKETIWGSQEQISVIFGIERSVVTKHIRNILKDKELNVDSVCAKIAHTAADGKTYQVQVYNLDVILSVGYRANSVKAIEFRQWATKTLREHITQGYTINRARIGQNYDKFMSAVEDVRALLPSHMVVDSKDILELIKSFATTWLSLDAYDKGELVTAGVTKKSVIITAKDLQDAVEQFKKTLVSKGEATDIFASERQSGSIEGIIGNVMQSFGGKSVYATVEEKSAHLLYFMVKNHPFVDGNKRSGAYAFIWFLQRAKLLSRSQITPPALTAITLLIAESDPKSKEKMVRLVMQMLRK